MRIGSLCSGYGGLDIAVERTLGATTAWFCEYDRDPSAILAHHWPHIPNHGDVKHTDWSQVEPVDILTAGYPCQPFSHAGKRKGSDDPRHLWPDVARAIGALRPRLVVLENVRGHVSLGLADVLGDLSGLGYDARWGVVRAADAGAPHGRARIFIVAHPSDLEGRGSAHQGERRRESDAGGGLRGTAAERHQTAQPVGATAADADGERHERVGDARRRWDGSADDDRASADTAGIGRGERRPEPARRVGGSALVVSGAAAADARGYGCVGCEECDSPAGRRVGAPCGRDPHGRVLAGWGVYGPAISRWESVLGRPAPDPTEPGRNGRPRLSPVFVEWLMGLDPGHVTDPAIGLSRNAQLKALGNGVVPQQAALALTILLDLARKDAA